MEFSLGRRQRTENPQALSMEEKIQWFAQDILIQGLDDELELGWIVGEAERFCRPEEIRPVVLNMIRGLLENRLIEIRDYNSERDSRWVVWNLSPEASIARIEAEWTALGRNPQFISGEIGWVITTEKGDVEARRLLAEHAPGQ